MAAIRPDDLPAAGIIPNTTALIIDTGSAVVKATPAQIVDVAAPVASSVEAAAGTDNTKRMTALRVKEAIDARPALESAAGLAALKAADTGQPKEFDQVIFTFTLGNYTGQADDTNIVQSDFLPLSTGAWVRQGADKIAATGEGTVQDAITARPPAFINRAAVLAATVPAGINRILTLSHTTLGDNGGAQWRRVGSLPAHPGYVTDASGAYFEIDQDEMRVETTGAKADWNGTTGTNNRAAIVAALKVLKAGVVDAIAFMPLGEYFCGSYGATQTTVFGAEGECTGLSGAIRGNGARLVATTTKDTSHDLFAFRQFRGLTISGLTAVETSPDLTVIRGLRAFSFVGGVSTFASGLTLRDVSAEGCLGAWSFYTDNAAATGRLTDITFEGACVARDCYYGINCQEDGDRMRGAITCFNVRRGYLIYGVREHQMTISCGRTVDALGSDGFVKIDRFTRNTLEIKVNLTCSGSISGITPVSLDHQNMDGAASIIDGVDVTLFVPEGAFGAGSNPLVRLRSYDVSGGASQTGVREHQTKRLSIKANFGTYGGEPFVKTDYIPAVPTAIKISSTTTLDKAAIQIPGWRIEQEPSVGLIEVTGSLNGQTLDIPVRHLGNQRYIIRFKLFAMEQETAASGGSDEMHWATGTVAAFSFTAGTPNNVGVISTDIVSEHAVDGSDLTFAFTGGSDFVRCTLASAADYNVSTAYARLEYEFEARSPWA
jgi:hypothetical protein